MGRCANGLDEAGQVTEAPDANAGTGDPAPPIRPCFAANSARGEKTAILGFPVQLPDASPGITTVTPMDLSNIALRLIQMITAAATANMTVLYGSTFGIRGVFSCQCITAGKRMLPPEELNSGVIISEMAMVAMKNGRKDKLP